MAGRFRIFRYEIRVWRGGRIPDVAEAVDSPNWKPLLITPAYPDYVSGYSGLTGAFTQAVEDALATSDVHLTLTSTAVAGAVRTYDAGSALRDDVVDARVWLGIHFRFADTGGMEMGQRVADWALTTTSAPREDDDD